MQDQPDTQTHHTSRPSLGEQSDGPPRSSGGARVSVALFAVLLAAALVAPVVTNSEAMPGLSLVFLGMLLLGVAELIDASSRGFLIAVRLGGIVFALLGLMVQVI